MEGTEAADDYFCADDAVETRTQFPNSLADEPEASGDFNFFDDQISDDEEVGVSCFHRVNPNLISREDKFSSLISRFHS